MLGGMAGVSVLLLAIQGYDIVHKTIHHRLFDDMGRNMRAHGFVFGPVQGCCCAIFSLDRSWSVLHRWLFEGVGGCSGDEISRGWDKVPAIRARRLVVLFAWGEVGGR